MDNKNKDSMVATLLVTDSEPSYSYLLEMKPEQLQYMRDECNTCIDELKRKLVEEYRNIRPALERMKKYKIDIRQLRDRHETLSMFMSLDRDSFALSSIDTFKRLPSSTEPRSLASLDRVFREILAEEEMPPPPPPSPPDDEIFMSPKVFSKQRQRSTTPVRRRANA
jgi:hypothetical protein